jgi:cytochrome c peroxidase
MSIKTVVLVFLYGVSLSSFAQNTLTYEQQLGKLLFNDRNLSANRNQSCATCHSLSPVKDSNGNKIAPAFVDLQNLLNGTPVSEGSIEFATGSLNAPSVAYASFSPNFHWDETEGLYVGGQFWNGRASNLSEQAKKPFLNPVEMAMPNEWAVISRLKENQTYRDLFWRVYQIDLNNVPHIKNNLFKSATPEQIPTIYSQLAQAIAAFEKSPVFNKFNAKYDYVLAKKTHLKPIEQLGLNLFNGKAKCSACHISTLSNDDKGQLLPPLFTDFTYDNIGLPRNLDIPSQPAPNQGLGGRGDIKKRDVNGDEIGKHKVMGLRNIALTAPYGHNGVLKTLEQVVHFYNTRDTLGQVADNKSAGFGVTGWPAPEISKNVNHDELGNLGLTANEEKAVVAFMKTLTDDYPQWGNDPLVPPGSAPPFE